MQNNDKERVYKCQGLRKKLFSIIPIFFQSFVSIVIAWKIMRYHICTNFDEFPIDITDAPSENQT